MKERWRKSNPSTIAIALGTQLLLNIVWPKGNNNNHGFNNNICQQQAPHAQAHKLLYCESSFDKQQSTMAR
jgi:hypothetical protein